MRITGSRIDLSGLPAAEAPFRAHEVIARMAERQALTIENCEIVYDRLRAHLIIRGRPRADSRLRLAMRRLLRWGAR